MSPAISLQRKSDPESICLNIKMQIMYVHESDLIKACIEV